MTSLVMLPHSVYKVSGKATSIGAAKGAGFCVAQSVYTYSEIYIDNWHHAAPRVQLLRCCELLHKGYN